MIAVTQGASVTSKVFDPDSGSDKVLTVHREVVYALRDDGIIWRTEMQASGLQGEWQKLDEVPR